MKEETPFNPVLGPDLNIPATDAKVRQPKARAPQRKTKTRTSSSSPKARRVPGAKASAARFARKATRKAKTSWRRVKRDLRVRLARLDAEQLKRILLACGVAATAALIIIALAKHVALVIVLLTVLGALVVLKLWHRILTLGI